jgi:hypothetical protein
MLMKRQQLSEEVGDPRWPDQKSKSLNLNKLIAVRWGGGLQEKGGPKMKGYPYGLLKIKEF